MLNVKLLGQFDIRLDAKPVEISHKPARLLLAYLLLNPGKIQQRDKLAGLLWPDSLETTARKNLRNAVWLLRQAIGEGYIQADRSTVSFDPVAPYELDVHLLESEAASDTGKLLQAVSAYAGELMPGYYEDWLQLERERLRAVFENRMQQLLEHLSAEARWPEAVTWAEHWIAQGDVPEPAYRALMVAHAALGDLAGVSTAYRRCQNALIEELGVQPSPDTVALYERLLQGERPGASGRRPKPGLSAGQRYAIESLLATGGHGEVYRGLDRQTGQAVVIKRLRPELLEQDPGLVGRFQREGQALRQLDHPNIVKMLDSYEKEGQQYIVLEYVPGGSLRELLEREGPLPMGRALDIALELADALSRAHHLKVIHRDLKPGNVLLAADGRPQLTDFGLAQMEGQDRQLTQSGSVLGSPAYLSPEALRGEELDGQTDIWAFGILLYEMLAGRHPFEGQQLGVLLASLLSEPIPSIINYRADTPPPLVDLLSRMLARDRNLRLASMRQVAAELEAIRAGRRTPFSVRPLVGQMAPVETRPENKLPLPATPCIGRDKELAELQRLLLATPDSHLVSIVGPGGIGKTRLALESAAAAAGAFPNGVYFVHLAPLETADHILPTLANTLGLHFRSAREPRDQFLDFLAGKQLLLVLDNFEHLLPGAEIIDDILRHAPGVKILVTTRERLHLSSEAVYLLGGMTYPEGDLPVGAFLPLSLDSRISGKFAEYGALQLLFYRARLVRPGLELSPGELVEMGRICRLVQGMPLAIILAASWLEMLSFKEIATEISQGLDILEGQMQDLPPHQRSMRATFERSWSQLPAPRQEVFMKLAVFRGGFTRRAAQTVAGADMHALRALIDKSLIASSRPERYEVHELLRQFAEEKLSQSGLEGESRDAHSAYFLDALAQREMDIKGRRQLEALDEIEVDVENSRAAWGWALNRRDWPAIDRALESLYLFFDTRARFREGLDLLGQALDLTALEEESLLHGRLLARSAFLRARYARGETSILADIENSSAIARRFGDPLEENFALLVAGYYHATVLDNFEEALPLFQSCLEGFQNLDEEFYQGRALHRVGYCFGRNDIDLFIRYTRQALDLAGESGNLIDAALALHNLGSGILAYGDYGASRRFLLQSIELGRQLGDRMTIAHSAALLGINYFLHGDLDQTLTMASESLSIATEINFPTTRAYALAILGLQAGLTGDHELGRQHGLASKSILSNHFGVFLADWTLAIAYNGLGQFDAASDALRAALKACLVYNWKADITWLLPCAAAVLTGLGLDDKALELLALYTANPLRPPGMADNWPLFAGLDLVLKQNLGPDRYQATWERGQNLDLVQTAERLVDLDLLSTSKGMVG